MEVVAEKPRVTFEVYRDSEGNLLCMTPNRLKAHTFLMLTSVLINQSTEHDKPIINLNYNQPNI